MAKKALSSSKRFGRNAELAKLGASVGTSYATTAARKLFASANRKVELDHSREMKNAAQIAERLGNMKGAMMKLGQMASYLDHGLPEPLRLALSELQSHAPPMSSALAEQVVESEFGKTVSELFIEWDPTPIAAASIGQVHRAIIADPATGEQRAVAVKVQYPGVAEAIASDLKNADLLGALLSFGFKSFNPDELVAEIKERLTEELDYTLEAHNQVAFAEFYRDHPFIHVPEVIGHLSTTRVLTTELVSGITWAELLERPQRDRDFVGEAIFRFVFRSLYRFLAFNGDPHPGNYIFHCDDNGVHKVSFLDYGLVKHFTRGEMDVFQNMITAAAINHDYDAFREVIEGAGLLQKDAPVDTQVAGEYFSLFYAPVRESHEMTWTAEYSSSIVRHTFDRTSPIAQYSTVPRSFVFIQRINLGLYALLGELGAVGNYRRIAEELWPMVNAGPSTPLGEAEAAWLAAKS